MTLSKTQSVAPPRARSPKVTLIDVARRAGVSPTTASFVLSGRTDMRISTQTMDRVTQAARVLNYTPKRPRSAQVGSKMPVIGFITDTVASDHFAGEMLRGGIAAAADHGHGIITADTEGAKSLEKGLITDLLEQGVEHFLFSAMATRTVRVPASLQTHRTVLLNCLDPNSDAPAIVPDEQMAGTSAVTTLLAAGHADRIWLVGEVTGGPFAGRKRRDAIVAALAAAGHTLARHVPCPWWPPDANQAMHEALRDADDEAAPSAVIAMNDRVAMGVYQAASEAGLAVPENLSVISFDNSDLAWWLKPELTSIGLPYYDMGRRAVEVLLESTPSQSVELVPMPVHSRASIAMSS